MKKLFLATIILSGILLALQMRSLKTVDALLQRSQPGSILAKVQTFQIANQALREQISEAEKELSETQQRLSAQSLEDEIKKLELLSGEQAVTGEGVEVTLSKAVPEFWISDLINELLSSGAEAVALNDVRFTHLTRGIRMVNGGVVVGITFVRAPLRIVAIGPQKKLFELLTQSGGIADRIEKNLPGVSIGVTQRDAVYIPAVSGL